MSICTEKRRHLKWVAEADEFSSARGIKKDAQASAIGL